MPISVFIVQQLGWPMRIITGMAQPSKHRRDVLINLLSWSGFVVIIVGGFWMQIRLDQLLHDVSALLRGVVPSSAVALELGLLMLIFRIAR